MSITRQEKIEVLTKMMNPEQTFFNKVKLEEKETMDRDGYDSPSVGCNSASRRDSFSFGLHQNWK